MSYQCVPLYDTLGENAVEYIINHSEVGGCLMAVCAALWSGNTGTLLGSGTVKQQQHAPAETLNVLSNITHSDAALRGGAGQQSV